MQEHTQLHAEEELFSDSVQVFVVSDAETYSLAWAPQRPTTDHVGSQSMSGHVKVAAAGVRLTHSRHGFVSAIAPRWLIRQGSAPRRARRSQRLQAPGWVSHQPVAVPSQVKSLSRMSSPGFNPASGQTRRRCGASLVASRPRAEECAGRRGAWKGCRWRTARASRLRLRTQQQIGHNPGCRRLAVEDDLVGLG